MHIPDGFFDVPTSVGGAAVAVAGVSHCVRRAGDRLDDRMVPMAGLVAAFVFAVQMLNFPVAAGTSGHLIGGGLAVVLVGPYLGALCVTVVLVIQALLFADGGLSALGLNVVNMALLGAVVSWAVLRGARAITARGRSGIVVTAGVASGLAVIAASVAFAAEYAIGGQGGASPASVAWAMIGVHVPIAIGEGIITAFTVSAVLASRPDLVEGVVPTPMAAGAPA